LAGVLFGAAAAVLYTAANVGLRQCVGVDPFLVAAVKAAPTVIFLGPILVWMLFRSVPVLTSGRMIPRFIVVALIGQFIGNAAFQVALEVIGLAVSVPITLGVLIIVGAILGRLVLFEPVRPTKMMAITILIAAIVILSSPSESTMPAESTSALSPLAGALCAAASGAAYALFGVVMRQTLNGGVTATLTMFISGVVGTVSLWSFALLRLGADAIFATQPDQWWTMSAAGLFNFAAFVALSYALKALPVVAVNLINASQVAMAAIAGVILFSEPVTVSLVAGVGLTFLGLSILATGRRKRS
jgi:drug/metabolite transporter (DMT)-like permease